MSPVEIQSNVTSADTHTFTTAHTYIPMSPLDIPTYIPMSALHITFKYELLCYKSCLSGK
jgi:hypothetical protein